MRKIATLLIFIIACITLFSCKKEKSDTKDSVSLSHWTLYSDTYKAIATYTNKSNGWALEATDYNNPTNTANSILIFFNKPSNSRSLKVLTPAGTTYDPDNTAWIQVVAYGNLYFSSGKSGDKIDVTILPNNKLKVTFSNVEVPSVLKGTALVSGTLIEE
ncbi:hypothetical protein [Niabella aquatica]